MVDSVVFFLADDSDYKGIDPQEMKELADAFNRELVTAFKDRCPIVADPGPTCARLRIAITNIHPSRPGVSAVTSIVPVGMGVSLVKKGATGGWSGSGDTGIEVMGLDSMTNEIPSLGVRHERKQPSSSGSRNGVRPTDAFKFWAARAVTFIDHAVGVRKTPRK